MKTVNVENLVEALADFRIAAFELAVCRQDLCGGAEGSEEADDWKQVMHYWAKLSQRAGEERLKEILRDTIVNSVKEKKDRNKQDKERERNGR